MSLEIQLKPEKAPGLCPARVKKTPKGWRIDRLDRWEDEPA